MSLLRHELGNDHVGPGRGRGEGEHAEKTGEDQDEEEGEVWGFHLIDLEWRRNRQNSARWHQLIQYTAQLAITMRLLHCIDPPAHQGSVVEQDETIEAPDAVGSIVVADLEGLFVGRDHRLGSLPVTEVAAKIGYRARRRGSPPFCRNARGSGRGQWLGALWVSKKGVSLPNELSSLAPGYKSTGGYRLFPDAEKMLLGPQKDLPAADRRGGGAAFTDRVLGDAFKFRPRPHHACHPGVEHKINQPAGRDG